MKNLRYFTGGVIAVYFILQLLSLDYDNFLNWSFNGKHFIKIGIAIGLVMLFGLIINKQKSSQ